MINVLTLNIYIYIHILNLHIYIYVCIAHALDHDSHGDCSCEVFVRPWAFLSMLSNIWTAASWSPTSTAPEMVGVDGRSFFE